MWPYYHIVTISRFGFSSSKNVDLDAFNSLQSNTKNCLEGINLFHYIILLDFL